MDYQGETGLCTALCVQLDLCSYGDIYTADYFIQFILIQMFRASAGNTVVCSLCSKAKMVDKHSTLISET